MSWLDAFDFHIDVVPYIEGSALTAIWFIYQTITPAQGRKLALRTTPKKRNISGLLKAES